MTPYNLACDLVEFIKTWLKEAEEKPYNVFVGFLPIALSKAEQKEFCPAIIVRPVEIADGEDETTATIGVYITDYDDDRYYRAESILHITEFLRFELLTNNPVVMKYNIQKGSMVTTIPDEQPYPQVWAAIHFDVNLPQPKRNFNGVFL